MGDRSSSRPWVRTPSLIFGCLWIAGAFSVLIYTFVANYIDKPVSAAEEMAIASAAAAHHAGAATRPL
jgi:hypothetical protein